MLLPSNSIFGPNSARWEIGGKIFKACFYYYDQVKYPTSVYVALLVKRDNAWDTLYKSDVYWPDLQSEVGADRALEGLTPHFNEAIRKELGLPEPEFKDKLQELMIAKLSPLVSSLELKK